MTKRLLQLNFSFNVGTDEYLATVSPLADALAAFPGLRWKVWLLDEAESAAGGLYMFEDQEAVQRFVDSELAAGILSHSALSNISVKTFHVIEDLTAITRGPHETNLHS